MLDKYKHLVAQLQNATSRKILPWNRTSREDEYEAAIGDNSVSIKHHHKNGNDEEYFSLFIWNKNGDIVDELRATSPSDDYFALSSLHQSATSAALRAEFTLDEILSDISKIG